jgi:hypothetical protein
MSGALGWLLLALGFVDTHNGAVTAIATIAMAGFTAALLFVSLRQSHLTRSMVDLARDEFEAEHRPWIALRDLYVSGPIFIGNDVGIPIELKLENVGGAPALGFFTYFDILAFERASGPRIDGALKAQIKKFARERKTPALGDGLPFGVVFPKDTLQHVDTVLVGVEKFRQINARENEINLSIIIVGTIFYSSPHGSSQHFTTFTYNMRLVGMSSRIRPSEFGDFDDVPMENVSTTKLHIGWTAK